MSLRVDIATQVTDELLANLNHLLPQLSSTAAPLTFDDLEGVVNSPTLQLFVARVDDVIVGTLTLVVFTIPTGVRGWIEDVVVDAGARGMGVGEALSLAAIDEARRLGVRSIDLTSRPSREEANALYQKLGFELRNTNVYRLALES
ncbi:MAG TPA: GNAT family N-acetyltransferase [Acidimicrobiales bacterium]